MLERIGIRAVQFESRGLELDRAGQRITLKVISGICEPLRKLISTGGSPYFYKKGTDYEVQKPNNNK